MYYDQLINYDQFINLGNDIQKEEFVNPAKLVKNATKVVKKTAPKVTNVVKKTAPKVTNVVNKRIVAAGALGTVALGIAADQGELGEDAKAIADNIENKVENAAKDTVNIVKKTANAAGGLVGDALWSFFKQPLYFLLLAIAIGSGVVGFGYCIICILFTQKYDRDFLKSLIVGVVGGGGCGFGAYSINKHTDS